MVVLIFLIGDPAAAQIEDVYATRAHDLVSVIGNECEHGHQESRTVNIITKTVLRYYTCLFIVRYCLQWVLV